MKLLVVVPGIMGSELRLPDEKVWPPKVREVIFGYKRLDKLMRDDLVVGDIISRVGPKGVYRSLIDDLHLCGYADQSADRRLLRFPYDWRRSNIESADKLAEVLDAFVAENIVDDITFLAHSMGGLVCRFLIESGRYTNQPFYALIKRLITLGTPHRGAPKALMQLEGEESNLGLSGIDIKTLGNDPRFPALFELVGPEDSAFTLERGLRGELPNVISHFDDRIQNDLGMHAENVAAARSFWGGLDTAAKPDFVAYMCVLGSSLETIVRNEKAPGLSDLIAIKRRDGGDGTVPAASAGLPDFPHLFSRKSHASIFEDRRFRHYLYQFLDAPNNAQPHSADAAIAAGLVDAVGITVGKDSYDVGEPIEIVLSYTNFRADPVESVHIQGCDQQTWLPDTDSPGVTIDLSLNGVTLEEWRFTAHPKLKPGLYKIEVGGVSDDPQATYFFVR